ncbi:MAG: M48 family metallopeptidase [Pseudomonadota bacterium]
MRKLTLIVVSLLLYACATSPMGRNQLILFPEGEMAQMGAAAFQDLQGELRVSDDAATNAYVRCVADAVLRTVPGERPEDWEVKVFEDSSANAFALPGRKIGVHTGLLEVAEDQSQLATVIGHEIAHVMAKHSNERVSTNYVTQSGLQLASIVAGNDTPMKRQLFGLLGLGAQVGVLLPFSRAQEAEADLMGLELLAEAGFDPRASVRLWQNMQAQGGDRPPEFLSTHPSSERRISELNARMREAMQTSSQARLAGRVPDCR